MRYLGRTTVAVVALLLAGAPTLRADTSQKVTWRVELGPWGVDLPATGAPPGPSARPDGFTEIPKAPGFGWTCLYGPGKRFPSPSPESSVSESRFLICYAEGRPDLNVAISLHCNPGEYEIQELSLSLSKPNDSVSLRLTCNHEVHLVKQRELARKAFERVNADLKAARDAAASPSLPASRKGGSSAD